MIRRGIATQTLEGVSAYRAARVERFIVQFDSVRPLAYCYGRVIIRRLAGALMHVSGALLQAGWHRQRCGKDTAAQRYTVVVEPDLATGTTFLRDENYD